METAEAKKQLVEAANALYNSGNREIDPIYPWVLVQVLPKEQKYKGVLILPDFSGKDKAQNKPMYEGVVLKTWKPFYRHFKKTRTDMQIGEKVIPGESYEYTEVWVESKLQPGDHILFPHWSGQPAGFLDEKEFRMVQEHSDYNPPPVPPAKIEYDGVDRKTSLKAEIGRALLARTELALEWHEELEETIANRIMGEFYVISKKTEAKTHSGR